MTENGQLLQRVEQEKIPPLRRYHGVIDTTETISDYFFGDYLYYLGKYIIIITKWRKLIMKQNIKVILIWLSLLLISSLLVS